MHGLNSWCITVKIMKRNWLPRFRSIFWFNINIFSMLLSKYWSLKFVIVLTSLRFDYVLKVQPSMWGGYLSYCMCRDPGILKNGPHSLVLIMSECRPQGDIVWLLMYIMWAINVSNCRSFRYRIYCKNLKVISSFAVIQNSEKNRKDHRYQQSQGVARSRIGSDELIYFDRLRCHRPAWAFT